MYEPTATFNVTELSAPGASSSEQILAHWTRTTLFPQPRIYDLRVRQKAVSPLTGHADWYELAVLDQVNRLLDMGLAQCDDGEGILKPSGRAYEALALARQDGREPRSAQD